MSHWSSAFFGRLYAEIYQKHILTLKRSREEIAFATEALHLRGKRVLDLAAGFGRHARLAARANRVCAVDTNCDYLARALKGLPRKAAANLCAARADMRRLPFRDGAFDAVLLLFNSFGYFLAPDTGTPGAVPHPDENVEVFRQIARVLKPGGDLLLEVPNRAPLLQAIKEAPRRHMVTTTYEIDEEYSYDPTTGVLTNRTLFQVGRQQEVASYRLRLYSPSELREMLRLCGLPAAKSYGSYAGEPFVARESEMLLVRAQKKGRFAGNISGRVNVLA